jgi:hypothetical protein
MKDQIDIETGEVVSAGVGYGHVVLADKHHFYCDFIKLQKALPISLQNDAKGDRGKYATYEAIMTTVRPIATKHGFIIVHGQTRSWAGDDGGSKIRLYDIFTDLIHVNSNQFRRTHIEIPVPKLDARSVGSAMTYGKRYTLLAALGLATSDDPTDDDGRSTQRNDLAQPEQESPLFAELAKGLSEASDIHEWRNDTKIDRKIKSLSETEFGMLRARFVQRMQEVS